LDNCHKIIEAVTAGTKLPVSVKIRAGIDNITALDFIKSIKDLPVSALMIHGRYFKNPFTDPIDFEMIRQVKKKFKGVVLGNGGVTTPELAKDMLDKTGVDGIGLARGIYGKPYLFDQIKIYLKTGKIREHDDKMIKKIILKHAKLALKAKGKHGIVELRKHLLWYVSGFPGAKETRKGLVRIESLKDIKEVLNDF